MALRCASVWMQGIRVIPSSAANASISFISSFVIAMADARHCPVSREMPEKMKEKLDNYLGRKRPKDA